MRRTLTALAAAVTVAVTTVATPTTADAQWRWRGGWGWRGPAFVGGLAAGALIGGATWGTWGRPYGYGYGYYGPYSSYGYYGGSPYYGSYYGSYSPYASYSYYGANSSPYVAVASPTYYYGGYPCRRTVWSGYQWTRYYVC